MEKNCLITRLKGSVTVDAPMFGHLEMILSQSDNPHYIMISSMPNEKTVVSGNNGIIFKNYTNQSEYSNPFILTSTMNGFKALCASDSKLIITNKYKLKPVLAAGNIYRYGVSGVKEFIGGIDNFIYSIPANTISLSITNCSLKLELSDILSRIKSINSSIIDFMFSANKLLEGNINEFLNIPNVRNIDISYNNHVYGTIADLKSITTIENIACAGTQVGGTIEEFVAGQRAAGRTTGTVSGNSAGWNNVTFNGSTTNAKGVVSWTADTITMNNVTINA